MGSRLYTVGRVGSFAHSTQRRYHLLITLDEQGQRSVAYHLLRQLGNEGVRAAKECAMPRVCVFDVIETMLDLQALDPLFQRIFGDVAARQEWFQQLLQSALVATVTNA